MEAIQANSAAVNQFARAAQEVVCKKEGETGRIGGGTPGQSGEGTFCSAEGGGDQIWRAASVARPRRHGEATRDGSFHAAGT
eukprot:2734047-Pyramimonas_sp.AAC.1